MKPKIRPGKLEWDVVFYHYVVFGGYTPDACPLMRELAPLLLVDHWDRFNTVRRAGWDEHDRLIAERVADEG